jgi:hypothetical protein
MALAARDARADDALFAYEEPRETLVPGNPGMPGGVHLMVNGFAELQNAGLGSHRISNAGVDSQSGGATLPLLQHDWAMAYARDKGGWVEGLLMLDFEPLTIGAQGVPELGQSGEGLWDAQHSHQFFHQVMAAVHPLAGLAGWHPEGMREGAYDLSVFGGQGSATIGPPIFMHRASNPGPTVPRKHHKGENPHETTPVLGTSLRVGSTWFETSLFGAEELTPQDSRFYPHPSAPTSAAARVRHVFGGWLEAQVSGERLRDQGHGEPDAWQLSASAYAWGEVHAWRFDALLDYGADVPDGGVSAHALLGELAVRSPDRRDVFWTRTEVDQREESPAIGGFVSSPWVFASLGFERVVVGGEACGLQVGVFGESTLGYIPPSIQFLYGTDVAVTVNVGLHVFGMWMLGDMPMHHRM